MKLAFMTLMIPALVAAGSSGDAWAKKTKTLGHDGYRVYDDAVPDLVAPFGMSATFGGGLGGYTSELTRDSLGNGVEWNARFMFGTRWWMGLEAAYLGSAHAADIGGLNEGAFLTTNGLEADLRLNLGREIWQPYLFAGAAWKHYALTDVKQNDSILRDSADIGELPFGGGLAMRYNGFVADARLEYRLAMTGRLFMGEGEGRPSELDNWAATARIGFEF